MAATSSSRSSRAPRTGAPRWCSAVARTQARLETLCWSSVAARGSRSATASSKTGLPASRALAKAQSRPQSSSRRKAPRRPPAHRASVSKTPRLGSCATAYAQAQFATFCVSKASACSAMYSAKASKSGVMVTPTLA